MLRRRDFCLLALGAAACGRQRGSGFAGYAFVANEEGQAIAAVDLTAFAVTRHIHVDGNPTTVVSHPAEPWVYALTADNATVHEIRADRLNLEASLKVGSRALAMKMAPDGRAVYVLCAEPPQLVRVHLNPLRIEWQMPVPRPAAGFELSPRAAIAAFSFGDAGAACFADLTLRKCGPTIAAGGTVGPLRFLSDGSALILANLDQSRLSLYDVASTRLITHLPLALRPERMCFNEDGGQLFVTGPGMDAVVVVYPYHTPQVAETVLAGRAPGAMAASANYLFIANPQSGDVSILDITRRRVVAVVSVGAEPDAVVVTPDDQYALVLNRRSGDMAVLWVGAIKPDRNKRAPLFTLIPVGSKPVSVAVRAV